MKYILFLLISSILFSCNTENKSEKSETEDISEPIINKAKEEEYSIIAVNFPEMGWGYQILKDGKLMIEQKHIPAIQGKKGFSSKQDAEKTAYFIIEKIKKGSFPPTISVEELDSLEVI